MFCSKLSVSINIFFLFLLAAGPVKTWIISDETSRAWLSSESNIKGGDFKKAETDLKKILSRELGDTDRLFILMKLLKTSMEYESTDLAKLGIRLAQELERPDVEEAIKQNQASLKEAGERSRNGNASKGVNGQSPQTLPDQNALPPITKDLLWQRTSTTDMGKFVFRLNKQDLNGNPEWTPGEKELPLSPNQAFVLAKKGLDQCTNSLKSWKLVSIKLVPCNPRSQESIDWQYVVRWEKFEKKGPGNKAVLFRYERGVLMDGSLTPQVFSSTNTFQK